MATKMFTRISGVILALMLAGMINFMACGGGGGGGSQGTVTTQKPVAEYTYTPSSGSPPLTVTFDGSASADSDGQIVTYQWDFGDNQIATGLTVNHTYYSAGSFKVVLTVIDDQGATGSTTKTIIIAESNRPPIAVFTFSPKTGDAPVTVTVDASASRDTDGSISSYSWDFGDGTTSTATEAVSTHTYTSVGDFKIKLTAIDNGGAQSQYTSLTSLTVTATLSGTISIPTGTIADTDVNDKNTIPISNNSMTEAQVVPNPVTIGGYVNVALNGQDGNSYLSGDRDDYYEVSLTGDEEIYLYSGDYSVNDLDLYLYDQNGLLIDASTGQTGSESITGMAQGTYFVRVYAQSGSSNYELNIGQALTTASADKSQSLRLSEDFVPGEILVRFAPVDKDFSISAATDIEKLGLTHIAGNKTECELLKLENASRLYVNRSVTMGAGDASPDDTRMISESLPEELKDKYDTLMAIKQLRKQKDVIYAEPNYIRHANVVTPSDQYYPVQWHYPQINLPQAWEISTGSSNITVAVIDTGVLLNHPDLAGQFVSGYDFISDPSNAGDGDGIDSNPEDPGDKAFDGYSSFHGTHVSGTVAAKTAYTTGSGVGVAGVAGTAKIMPLRVLGLQGGTSYDIVQAVKYGAGLSNDSGQIPSAPVDVMNLSLSGGSYSQSEQNAFDQARQKGIIVVAAAGNSSTSVPAYPAAYDGVIAVSAVGYRKNLTSYSNYGSWIDIAAPGGDLSTDLNSDGYPDGVLSTVGDDSGATLKYGYAFMDGTSMASPHVAGVAALMKSIYPQLSPDTFDQLLSQGKLTTDLGSTGKDTKYGYGLIDAFKAVSEAQTLAGSGSTPVQAELVLTPASINFGHVLTETEITAKNVGTDALTLTLPQSQASWLTITTDSVDQNNLGTYKLTVDRQNLAAGNYQTSVVFASSVNTITVPVQMQVASQTFQSDAGFHYILLVSGPNKDTVKSYKTAAVDGKYTFEFQGVSKGTYRIYAGTNYNNNRYIGDPGEAFTAYKTLDLPEEINVTASLDDLDFSTGYRNTISSTQSQTNTKTQTDAGEVILIEKDVSNPNKEQ